MSAPRTRRLPVIVLATTLALTTPMMLSGCSLLHLPGSGGSSKGGGINIPGVGSIGTGKLPNDFPSDVPVAKGDIVSGISAGSGDDQAWNVSVKVSSLDAFDDIEKQLTGAGFTEATDSPLKSDQGDVGTFTSDKYDVAVAVVKADDKNGFVANYTVTKHKSDNG